MCIRDSPNRLMRKLAGLISTENASAEWWEEVNNETNSDSRNAGDPLRVNHSCTSCYLQGKTSYMLPAKEFGITKPQDFYSKYISQGSWTRCLQCQQQLTTNSSVCKQTSCTNVDSKSTHLKSANIDLGSENDIK